VPAGPVAGTYVIKNHDFRRGARCSSISVFRGHRHNLDRSSAVTRWFRQSAVVAALCAAAVAPMPVATAPAAAQSPRPVSTDVRIFAPLNGGKLAPGLAAAGPVRGKCFTASLATQGRPDAWRCSAGNTILDPCFESQPPGEGPLACAVSPWSSQVRLLTPAEPVPRNEANQGDLLSQMPWALELADGSRCTYLTGATMAVAGMRLNYGCVGGASVIGEVYRGNPLWRVFVRPVSGAVIKQVDVRTAWY
jgi:hypothetical protein